MTTTTLGAVYNANPVDAGKPKAFPAAEARAEDCSQEERLSEETPPKSNFPKMTVSDVMEQLPALGKFLQGVDQGPGGNKDQWVDESELAKVSDGYVQAYYRLAHQPELLAQFKEQAARTLSHVRLHSDGLAMFFRVDINQAKATWDKLSEATQSQAITFLMAELKGNSVGKYSAETLAARFASYLTLGKFPNVYFV